MPRCTALVLLVVATVLGGACGVSDLNFVQDDRVRIVSPEDRSKVSLPVTIRWTADDFDGTFAVFLDRAPVPPGRSLDWLARDDDLCRDTPGCPGPEWFTSRQVFPTADRQITIDDVPELTRDERRVFHEVTVVLIDQNGERVGESAFTTEFEVERGR
jgi:hypothetical protein